MSTSTKAPDDSILHVNRRPARFRVTKTWEVDAEVEDSQRSDGRGVRCTGWPVDCGSLVDLLDENKGYSLTIERIDEGD